MIQVLCVMGELPFKMAVWEDPELVSSHRHNRSTVTQGKTSPEKDLRTTGIRSSTIDKQARTRWVGESETRSCQKLHPQHNTHIREESHKYGACPCMERSLCPASVPQSLGPAPERRAPKISGFENQQDICLRKPQGCREPRLHS